MSIDSEINAKIADIGLLFLQKQEALLKEIEDLKKDRDRYKERYLEYANKYSKLLIFGTTKYIN